MVTHVRELRGKAVLCRRVASIPTSGAGNADRILMRFAEQLERDAVLLERQLRGGKSLTQANATLPANISGLRRP
jgi:hypothetical protein